VNLLKSPCSQISNAIEALILDEETRQAYENLRAAPRALLHSETGGIGI